MRGVLAASSPAGRSMSSPFFNHRLPSKLSSLSSATSPPRPDSLLLLRPPRPPRDSRRATRRRSPRPRPPRTSEFWYEDEEEFDAIAGSLRRKTVYIVAAGGGGEAGEEAAATAAARELAGVSFDACFYGQAGDDDDDAATTSSCGPALSALWPASRSGPPYFLRPRRRPALDALSRVAAAGGSKATTSEAEAEANAADSAWAEIASQNWRVELAYGLGAAGGSKSSGSGTPLLDPERPESVLVVVAPPEAARALARAAALGGGATTPPAADQPYAVVTLREWEGGGDSADAAAPGWRYLLER